MGKNLFLGLLFLWSNLTWCLKVVAPRVELADKGSEVGVLLIEKIPFQLKYALPIAKFRGPVAVDKIQRKHVFYLDVTCEPQGTSQLFSATYRVYFGLSYAPKYDKSKNSKLLILGEEVIRLERWNDGELVETVQRRVDYDTKTKLLEWGPWEHELKKIVDFKKLIEAP